MTGRGSGQAGPAGRRRGLAGLLAAALLAGLATVAPPGAAPVAAAAPQLTLVSTARYDVQPDQHRVHVTIDAKVTSHTTDTVTTAYYFQDIPLTVLPDTSGFAATIGGKPIGVSVTRRATTFTALDVVFGQRVGSGKSLSFELQFDIIDPGGAPARSVRIDPSLVSFDVWAYATADTPGSSVSVVFPAGYTVRQDAGNFPAPTTDAAGRTIFQSGTLAAPSDFYAHLSADRPGAFATTQATVDGLTVLVSAWTDDPAWGRQVSDLVSRGLPVLDRLIGLGPPRFPQLTFQESVSSNLGGYSGLFDPTTGRIEISYSADPFVILHEAAHAWFNSRLATDRWVDEAFASYYADRAAAELGLKVAPEPMTPTLEASKIQLNDWGAVGNEAPAVEDYAYAATLALADLVGRRATDAGLAKVWSAMAAGQAAYQPAHGPAVEKNMAGSPDWRVLLDQLEERTGANYDDLWQTWVVSPGQLPLLDARAAARRDYAASLAAAGSWNLPWSIRGALSAWQFPAAEQLIAAADGILGQRDTIARHSAADGLTPPPTLRTAFEGATGSLGVVAAEARDELATLDAIDAATAASRPDRGLVGAVGLLGANPASGLASARTAFSAGDLAVAVEAADAARAIWEGAEAAGRERLLFSLALVLVLGLFAILLLRGRRRRARLALGGAYGTLGRGASAGDGADVQRPSGEPRAGQGGEDLR